MYTFSMRKLPDTPRWWDWPSVFMLFLLLELTASRLVTTEWTSFLYLSQIAVYMGYAIGTALGYSRFSLRTSRWVSFFYMLIMLPLQWTLAMEQTTTLEVQLASAARRLYFSLANFFSRLPVDDSFFFIAFITITFWILSASAGFQLVRRQKYIPAVIPSAIALLVIQYYDNLVESRLWPIAFYTFLALLLLGRMNHLEDKRSWRERRVFLSPDNSIDIAGITTIAAVLLIFFAWTLPATISSFDAATRTWNKITQPWRSFTDRMQNAVTALESPSGGKRGEFFGSEIALGTGFPLSDMVMFRVQVPDLPSAKTPPRYYWRGRTYDFFWENQWYTTGTVLEEYSPSDEITLPPSVKSSEPSLFFFNTGEITYSLVYAPSQAVWFSRSGSTRFTPAGKYEDVTSWYAYPSLNAGEAYQISAVLSNPDVQELRNTGTYYPTWVTDRYLQLPEEFSPRISELAALLTNDYDNPFDKTASITRYLRNNIEYADSIPQTPRNKDPLEWMLFENKQGYCVYYASAEILMLRSVGIPARMAVGFSQGERNSTGYTVRKYDAHAWPEVYFPGIGWVEFEPTANQPTLNRPTPPQAREIADNITPDLIDFLELEKNIEQIPDQKSVQSLDDTSSADETPVLPYSYLIPLFIIFAALTVFFSRKYSVPSRIPVVLRNAYEQNGLQPPAWIVNWELWTFISPIERSFDSINFGLRTLKKDMPIDATPLERAQVLMALLPKIKSEIITLLDEHQTSLYTSKEADVTRARRAALRIRWQVILERIRYRIKGRSLEIP